MSSLIACIRELTSDDPQESWVKSALSRDPEMGENFLDFKKAVENWAWREFDKTATKSQKKLKQKNDKSGSHIGIKIDWCDVRFREETRWAHLADADLSDDVNKNDSSAVKREVSESADAGTPHTSILFQTTFHNDTESEQEYCMKTEKTTKSSFMVALETGYTRGFEFGITLKSPCEVLEANAGYHREYTLNNVEEQTFEEELTWGVESQIKVKAKNVAEANLVVCEKKQKGDFTMLTHVTGTVYVSFTNIRDNNSLLKATGHDVVEILEEHVKQERRKGHEMTYVDIRDGHVQVTTTGNCKFRYGIKQEVKVHQRPLSAK